MTAQKPLIFISNDDSINAKGLYHLIDCVKDMGDVVVVAPDEQHSGQSSAITVEDPLYITPHNDYHGVKRYSVNGTPVDCIKLGLSAVLERTPDLVLAGINHGSNSGNSVIYSGTMGAVIEACMSDIPAIGYSLLAYDPDADFSSSTAVIKTLTARVLSTGLPKGICLNVNIPKEMPLGTKVVRATRGHWAEEYEQCNDSNGRTCYCLSGWFVNDETNFQETDNYWLEHGYATIVPVCPDQSAIDKIGEIAKLLNL